MRTATAAINRKCGTIVFAVILFTISLLSAFTENLTKQQKRMGLFAPFGFQNPSRHVPRTCAVYHMRRLSVFVDCIPVVPTRERFRVSGHTKYLVVFSLVGCSFACELSRCFHVISALSHWKKTVKNGLKIE